jgi:hypothetical protein
MAHGNHPKQSMDPAVEKDVSAATRCRRSVPALKKMCGGLVVAGCLAARAFAADLTWDELAHRPDFWPDQCTAVRPMNLADGTSVKAGQKLNVVEVKDNQVDVFTPDGRKVFALPPLGTDVLAEASAAWAGLTPKQRELTYEMLTQRTDLWPLRVKLQTTLDLGGGKQLRQGESVRLISVNRGMVTVQAGSLTSSYNLSVRSTDLMAQARIFVEDDHAGPRFVALDRHALEVAEREGPVVTGLEGKLVNSLTGLPEPLEAGAVPRYFLFFRGSSKDPFTRGVTPTLVKFYKEVKPRHPELEVIYLMAESPEGTAKFAKKMGFAWRAVTEENAAAIPVLGDRLVAQLPQIIVMDRNGDVLINAAQTNALTALREVDTLLQTPVGN